MVWDCAQVIFDLVHVLPRATPIVIIKIVKAGKSIAFDAAGTIDILLGLYDSEKNEELKDQIIYSLGSSNDPRVVDKLIEIARNPQTPIERRRHAIVWLSRVQDPKVQKFLEDLLKQ